MKDPQANQELVLAMVQLSLRDTLAIHQMMFDRLLLDEDQFALQLAELLEDAANRYLDLSEAISANYLKKKRQGGHLSGPTTRDAAG